MREKVTNWRYEVASKYEYLNKTSYS